MKNSQLFNFMLDMATFGLSSTLLTLVVTILLVTVVYSFLLKNQLRRNKNVSTQYPLPPGPKPWPIIGNIAEMLINKPTFRWIHQMMADMNTEIACIRLGNVHVIPVTSPEIGREFLRKQDSVFSSRPVIMAADLTSSGYLSTALTPLGEQWKKMRRVLASELLSPAKHRWLHEKRAEEANHLVFYVHNQCIDSVTCGTVNVRIAAQHYCGNVIRKMIFSKRFFGEERVDGGPGGEEQEHVTALFTILNYLYSFCISDYFPILRLRVDLDGHEKIIRKAVGSLRKYHDPEIDQRIHLWKDGMKKEQQDLLDVLITLKDTNGAPLLSPEEIKAQIIELMIATVDNPSNCVEWVIAEMINQPETLQKAIYELDNVVGKERLVQESDLSHLNYVKACAREGFRLHPIAPFNVPHVSVSDTVVAGYFIPKGSHVLLSRPGLGRNPRVWDEPLEFKPERHLKDGSEVVLAEPGLRMLSFSTGRRGCAGVTLGSTMTTMLLARLLQAFTWSVPPTLSRIDLHESANDLFLAEPLIALAKPRLAHHLYPSTLKF